MTIKITVVQVQTKTKKKKKKIRFYIGSCDILGQVYLHPRNFGCYMTIIILNYLFKFKIIQIGDYER
jgi:hypothetical protein